MNGVYARHKIGGERITGTRTGIQIEVLADRGFLSGGVKYSGK